MGIEQGLAMLLVGIVALIIGGTNHFQSWKDKHQLHIIGTGGCRSRAIPCSDLEF